MKISVENIDITNQIQDRAKFNLWISQVAASYDCKIGQLTYVFCDDEYLHKINVDHLEHDTYTDIITFDYSTPDVINGEIYVSVDRIKENASKMGLDYESEFLRVVIHGVLHLCGYKDKSDEQKLVMREQEEICVSLYLLEK
ncbi:MAG: rRNA maturation RNase YbeY [Bacteroidales bacterium]|nr:rRNA maturation RNase YbeY [Bacteroidales bacterium]